MLLRLPSGTAIAFPPYFLRQPRGAHLTISCESVFHPDHITSRLCLQFLDEALHPVPFRSLLDIGCGTGILALLAACKGVPFVTGLDIDRRAIALSRKNARRNNLAGTVHWLLGTIDAVRHRFECVVANLPFAVLDGILADLQELIEPGGLVILSGFHDIQWHGIQGSLGSPGFALERSASGDQSFYGAPPSGSFTWMAVQLRKVTPAQAGP